MSGSVCRTCSATIRFVTLDTGKPIPVEPHPSPDRGNVAAVRAGRGLVGYVISQAKPLRDGYVTYLPHFAVCQPAKAPSTPKSDPPSLFDPGAA